MIYRSSKLAHSGKVIAGASCCVAVILFYLYWRWQTYHIFNTWGRDVDDADILALRRPKWNFRPNPSRGCEGREKETSIKGFSFMCKTVIQVSPNMNLDTARETYYRQLHQLDVKCLSSVQVGGHLLKDGGWSVCLMKPFYLHTPCLVYSFGIRDDWTFDEGMAANYGCKVKSFDPSIGMDDHTHSPGVEFYNLGLGGQNRVNSKGWKLETLDTTRKRLGHANVTLEVLKFDIEYSEWASLDAMINNGSLRKVKQLAFEVHSWRDTVRDYLFFSRVLTGLKNLGFEKWKVERAGSPIFHCAIVGLTRYCPAQMLYFINTNYL